MVNALSQGDNVNSREEGISEAHGKHGGDVSSGIFCMRGNEVRRCEEWVLESVSIKGRRISAHKRGIEFLKQRFFFRTESVGLSGELVTSGGSTRHQVEISRLEDAGLELSGEVGALLSLNDEEVVVRKMAPGVSLSADGRAKDHDILSNGAVQQGHVAHGASSDVEDPFLVGVDVLGVNFGELVGDSVDLLLHRNVHLSSLRGHTMKNFGVKDIEALPIEINRDEKKRDHQDQYGRENEATAHFQIGNYWAMVGALGNQGQRAVDDSWSQLGLSPKTDRWHRAALQAGGETIRGSAVGANNRRKSSQMINLVQQ